MDGGTRLTGADALAPPAIHILDEVVVKPGLAGAYRDAYHADYVPLARTRGMTLLLSSRSPAVDVADVPTTLLFLWSVPDVAAWWAMRVRDAAAKAAWWQAGEAMTITRKRLMLGGFWPDADA